ncbi:MAG: hypothetical protein K2K46_01010 [Lachnospiraceae bacterium]|nr:hypothetical protein [Lachnospiraceae bacterium]
MNVNGITKQTYYENNNSVKTNNKKGGHGFYESLSENINDMNGNSQKSAAAPKSSVPTKPYAYRNVPSVESYDSDIVNVSSVTGCEVRQITYSDSDYVKVFAKQGYTLMMQVDIDNRSVYVERRMEDGSVSGYEVEFDKIADDTNNPIELAALEAWGKTLLDKKVAGTSGESEEEAISIEEALKQFYEFIQDRIKNGPPKYAIGNSEFSKDEWDKLLASIDEQLEDVKEEVEDRVEKIEAMQLRAELEKEKEEENKAIKGVEKTSEELLTGLSQEEEDEEKNAAKTSSKQYISADEVAGLDSTQLIEKALLRGREEYAGVPYGYLAKNGVIEYNGVTFVCDKEHKAIHLGDTSDKNKCITIPLSKGGCLIVNRDSLGGLARAIGMFSPEDVNLIMRAIAEDAKIQQMKQQIDEDESGIKLVEDVEEAEAELMEDALNIGGMTDSFENKTEK